CWGIFVFRRRVYLFSPDSCRDRTEKLSLSRMLSGPMVLHISGRVGSCHIYLKSLVHIVQGFFAAQIFDLSSLRICSAFFLIIMGSSCCKNCMLAKVFPCLRFCRGSMLSMRIASSTSPICCRCKFDKFISQTRFPSSCTP